MAEHEVVVDLWFDPVCPYSWTASRWLVDVGRRRPLDVRHHVMSLHLLNEHRTDVDPDYRRSVEDSRGPARVATAAATRFGEEVLPAFYTAFGELVFDVWRRPSAQEYHDALQVALPRAGLPVDLAVAMDSDEHDAALRASHDTAVALAGSDLGTPVTRIGDLAFFGPVLHAVPRGREADDVFEGARLLGGCPGFFELKRTRVAPPVLT